MLINSDTTKYQSFKMSDLKSTAVPSGKGSGNPLQYSCLENPMGGGAW